MSRSEIKKTNTKEMGEDNRILETMTLEITLKNMTEMRMNMKKCSPFFVSLEPFYVIVPLRNLFASFPFIKTRRKGHN